MKPVIHRGHTIEIERFQSHNASGRAYPLWNARIDGRWMHSYNLHTRKAALNEAKQQVDSKEAQ